MTSGTQKLQLVENYATAIRTTCDRILDEPPPDMPPTLRDQITELRRLSADTEKQARSPVRIGVVGEFSAGKTLLLGAMIGFADGLPVAERPMTGNVTALQFELVDELRATEVGPFDVEFLDHQGVEECLAFMLAEARQRAAVAGLRGDLREQLDALDPHSPDTLNRFEPWARDAWAGTTNPGLRFLLREMLVFTRAHKQCGTGLCGGSEPFRISTDKARNGLTLADLPRDIQALAFDQLPPAPPALSSRPDELSARLIEAAFPLIRRLTAHVKLSKHVWDFSELIGSNPFVLLDFPGLGAANSGVRDLYLCLRELAEVQTILILLDANKPGGNEGAQLYDLLQKNRRGQDIRDAVLVGVGRFDLLPLRDEGRVRLRELAGPSAAAPSPGASRTTVFTDEEDAGDSSAGSRGKLTEPDVLREVPILNTCVTGAESIVRQGRRDRVVLLSPLLHLHLLTERYGTTLRVGSEPFLEHLPVDVEPALGLRKLWQGLSKRLEHDSPGNRSRPGLAQWLDDLASDGGLSRLRLLIQSHVQAHGVAQLSDAIMDKARHLHDRQKQLNDVLGPPRTGRDLRLAADRLEKYEAKLKDLHELYRRLEHDVKQARPLTLMQDGRERSVSDVVHEETVHRVFEWVQWERLLTASRNGYVTEPKDTGTSIFTDEEEGEEAAAEGTDGFPTTSDDFYSSFERTLEELRAVVLEQVLTGLRDSLSGLRRAVAAAREELESPLADPGITKRLRALRLGDRGRGLVPALRAAVNPETMESHIVPQGDIQKLGLDWPKAQDLFPLARQDKAGAAGRVFAWSRNLQDAAEGSRPDPHCSHQSQVLRLRDEFITTISQEMTQIVGVATYKINQQLKKVVEEINEKLSVIVSRPDVLAEFVRGGAEETGTTDTADPLSLVRQLGAVPMPVDGTGRT